MSVEAVRGEDHTLVVTEGAGVMGGDILKETWTDLPSTAHTGE